MALKIHKPYTCTCLCLNRPVIHVDYTEDGQEMYLGKIEDEYDFCNFNFNIFDKNGKKVFRVHAGCC